MKHQRLERAATGAPSHAPPSGVTRTCALAPLGTIRAERPSRAAPLVCGFVLQIYQREENTMRAFILIALFGITVSGCVQLQEDEELSPDELSSVEEAVVAGCSITASKPVQGTCNVNGVNVNGIIGKATVSCTTTQSRITVTATLQKISADGQSVLDRWNHDTSCGNVKTCFSFACTSFASGSYNTFGSSAHTGISGASPTATF
jgi:hypothetical protein